MECQLDAHRERRPPVHHGELPARQRRDGARSAERLAARGRRHRLGRRPRADRVIWRRRYDVQIADAEVLPENLDSIDAITRYVVDAPEQPARTRMPAPDGPLSLESLRLDAERATQEITESLKARSSSARCAGAGAVVALSGGVDSSVCVGALRARPSGPNACSRC